MPFWDRFTRVWASAGTATEPTDSQAAQGFAYLGDNPPTVEQYNALFAMLDQKDGWLYRQIANVIARSGQTPQQVGDTQMIDALSIIGMHNPIPITATTYVTAPVWARSAFVKLIGPGGAGGGSAGANGGGSAGGGGELRWGVFAVTGGGVYLCTIGQPGAPGTGAPTDGGAGTPTIFGPFIAAYPGLPGGAGNGVVNPTPGAGGGPGTGGTGLNGFSGGITFGTAQRGQAQGGGVPLTSGAAPSGASTAGSNAGLFPGGGGNGGIGGGAGGAGAQGYIEIVWLP